MAKKHRNPAPQVQPVSPDQAGPGGDEPRAVFDDSENAPAAAGPGLGPDPDDIGPHVVSAESLEGHPIRMPQSPIGPNPAITATPYPAENVKAPDLRPGSGAASDYIEGTVDERPVLSDLPAASLGVAETGDLPSVPVGYGDNDDERSMRGGSGPNFGLARPLHTDRGFVGRRLGEVLDPLSMVEESIRASFRSFIRKTVGLPVGFGSAASLGKPIDNVLRNLLSAIDELKGVLADADFIDMVLETYLFSRSYSWRKNSLPTYRMVYDSLREGIFAMRGRTARALAYRGATYVVSPHTVEFVAHYLTCLAWRADIVSPPRKSNETRYLRTWLPTASDLTSFVAEVFIESFIKQTPSGDNNYYVNLEPMREYARANCSALSIALNVVNPAVRSYLRGCQAIVRYTLDGPPSDDDTPTILEWAGVFQFTAEEQLALHDGAPEPKLKTELMFAEYWPILMQRLANHRDLALIPASQMPSYTTIQEVQHVNRPCRQLVILRHSYPDDDKIAVATYGTRLRGMTLYQTGKGVLGTTGDVVDVVPSHTSEALASRMPREHVDGIMVVSTLSKLEVEFLARSTSSHVTVCRRRSDRKRVQITYHFNCVDTDAASKIADQTGTAFKTTDPLRRVALLPAAEATSAMPWYSDVVDSVTSGTLENGQLIVDSNLDWWLRGSKSVSVHVKLPAKGGPLTEYEVPVSLNGVLGNDSSFNIVGVPTAFTRRFEEEVTITKALYDIFIGEANPLATWITDSGALRTVFDPGDRHLVHHHVLTNLVKRTRDSQLVVDMIDNWATNRYYPTRKARNPIERASVLESRASIARALVRLIFSRETSDAYDFLIKKVLDDARLMTTLADAEE